MSSDTKINIILMCVVTMYLWELIGLIGRVLK